MVVPGSDGILGPLPWERAVHGGLPTASVGEVFLSAPDTPGRTIHSIGHSNHAIGVLIGLLQAWGIRRVADVRRFPSSRRHPHFNRPALAAALREAGLLYRHFPGLGGHRTGRPGSPHVALPEGGFRAYADHMGSAEFAEALRALEAWAEEESAAFLCAEASPEHCHRRYLSDALLRDGFAVRHILDESRVEPHRHPPELRLRDGELVYDGVATPLELPFPE